MHWRRRDQQRHLQDMLRGFYQYFRFGHLQRFKRYRWRPTAHRARSSSASR
jgi:hypothetical protein